MRILKTITSRKNFDVTGSCGNIDKKKLKDQEKKIAIGYSRKDQPPYFYYILLRNLSTVEFTYFQALFKENRLKN